MIQKGIETAIEITIDKNEILEKLNLRKSANIEKAHPFRRSKVQILKKLTR